MRQPYADPVTIDAHPPRTAPFWGFALAICAVAMLGTGICGALGGPFGAVLASLHASWYVAAACLVHVCLGGQLRGRRGVIGWALVLAIQLPIASALLPLLTAISADLHAEVFFEAWPPILVTEAAADLLTLMALAVGAKRTLPLDTVEQQAPDGSASSGVTS